MTLPFRRRHHDDEASHDRARTLASTSLLESLPDADRAWLDRHLERCPECRAERDAFLADRTLLRGLRETAPPPPRDLWARTSAAIEREAGSRRSRRAPLTSPLVLGDRRGLPLGPLAGVLVAAVVLAVALLPHGGAFVPPIVPSSFQVALGSPPPGPTAIAVPAADQVAWVQSNSDGKFSVVLAQVGEVCPAGDTGCATLAGGSTVPLDVTSQPQAVVRSSDGQLAIVGSAGETNGSVFIVTVSSPSPSNPASSFGLESPASSLVPQSPVPQSLAPVSVAPASPPASSAGTSSPASPSGNPAGAGHAIIHGVVVVGEAAYSDDGQWFAFSARPLDGSAGPDLYVWHVGDDQASRLTSNGATFFAGWFGDQIVASGILGESESNTPSGPPAAPGASGAASQTGLPTSTPASSAPNPSSAASNAVSNPVASSPPVAPIEAHPFSFLLDPATGIRTDFALPDVWLPSIDRTGRFVTYWSGTVTPDTTASDLPTATGRSWRPATGRLVLDGWSSPLAVTQETPPSAPSASSASVPPASAAPVQIHGAAHASAAPGGSAAASESGTPSPTLAVGPAGTPWLLADGPLGDFQARFDPTGTRLAVWTANATDTTLGPLWLVVLDPVAGAPNETVQPLPAGGIVALRGFSIEEGRLGWVTPPGQDAQPSSVQVLAWQGDEFGKVQTVPGGNPQIVR